MWKIKDGHQVIVIVHTAFFPGHLNMRDSSQELWLMVNKVTFNKISIISWQSDLLMEKNWVLTSNHQP